MRVGVDPTWHHLIDSIELIKVRIRLSVDGDRNLYFLTTFNSNSTVSCRPLRDIIPLFCLEANLYIRWFYQYRMMNIVAYGVTLSTQSSAKSFSLFTRLCHI